MRCPIETGEAMDLFVRHSAGVLGMNERSSVARHLEECPACREQARSQATVWSALDGWEPEPVSSNFDQRLYARIAADAQLPWYRRAFNLNWSLRPAVPVVAACSAILAAVLLIGPLADHPTAVMPQPHLDIQQVEQALDDIDMLKQLDVVVPVSKQSRRSEAL